MGRAPAPSSQCRKWASTDPTTLGNASVEFGVPEVCCFNDNRRELFTVRNASPNERPIAQGRPGVFAPPRQLIATDDDADPFVIYAAKKTDVLRIRHATIPLGIDLDPSRSGSAVRAAFYSAAEMLRRSWAVELDIDPEEIDIPPIQIVEIPGEPWQRQGVMTLADHHPNGAGFVTELQRQWSNHLTDLIDGRTKVRQRHSRHDKRARCQVQSGVLHMPPKLPQSVHRWLAGLAPGRRCLAPTLRWLLCSGARWQLRGVGDVGRLACISCPQRWRVHLRIRQRRSNEIRTRPFGRNGHPCDTSSGTLRLVPFITSS